MRNFSTGSIVFNASGGAVILTVIAYLGSGFLGHERIEPCSTRYPAGKEFALDNQRGEILTPMEIQGRVASREWGLLKNAVVVGVDGKGRNASLKISLESVGDDDHPARNGVGFVWQTPELMEARAVCLSYRARLSSEFDFLGAGRLPGIYTAPDPSELDGPMGIDSFAARPAWREHGTIGLEFRSGAGKLWSQTTGAWPRARWVAIEQEAILNTPGNSDGILRLWVDGTMVAENKGLALWSGERRGFDGVVSDIGYTQGSSLSEVQVSPFTVQWRR